MGFQIARLRPELSIRLFPATPTPSHPFKCKYKAGIVNTTIEGKVVHLLHAIQMDYYNDAGAYIFDSDATVAQAMTTCDNCYYCPNWQVTPHVSGPWALELPLPATALRPRPAP